MLRLCRNRAFPKTNSPPPFAAESNEPLETQMEQKQGAQPEAASRDAQYGDLQLGLVTHRGNLVQGHSQFGLEYRADLTHVATIWLSSVRVNFRKTSSSEPGFSCSALISSTVPWARSLP